LREDTKGAKLIHLIILSYSQDGEPAFTCGHWRRAPRKAIPQLGPHALVLTQTDQRRHNRRSFDGLHFPQCAA
jgi:hypothetical protein